jgi:hypothetical protein
VVVRAKPLTPEEAIGNPERDDFPLFSGQKAKVKLPPKEKGPVSICPSCGEAHPASEGELCLRCSGKDDYYEIKTL